MTEIDAVTDEEWGRFQKFIYEDPNGGCWLWGGAGGYSKSCGYGRFGVGVSPHKRLGLAHRIAYTRLVGPIPEGLFLDHLCRVHQCCNPAHLEPVTPGENLRRSPLTQGNKTHCPQGHPYSVENTYRRVDERGYIHRHCWTCLRARARAVRDKRLVAA